MAGPVVAAAVVLDPSEVALWWAELRDSKLLSPRARERAADAIRPNAEVGVGVVGPDVIDALGISAATCRAMDLALKALSPAPDYVLIDGRPVPGHRGPLLDIEKMTPPQAVTEIVAAIEAMRE